MQYSSIIITIAILSPLKQIYYLQKTNMKNKGDILHRSEELQCKNNIVFSTTTNQDLKSERSLRNNHPYILRDKSQNKTGPSFKTNQHNKAPSFIRTKQKINLASKIKRYLTKEEIQQQNSKLHTKNCFQVQNHSFGFRISFYKPIFQAGNRQKNLFSQCSRTSCISLQDFNIIKKLGRGSTGAVFLVKQRKIGMLFALKQMHKKVFLQKQRMKLSLKRQIITQSSLEHKNVVKMFGYFSDQNNIYLILQYAGENTLFDYFQCKNKQTISKMIPDRKIPRIIKQICKAVQHMHQKDIIHRDLKLQNIIIENNLIKIGDFGCAVQSSDLRLTQIGSLPYWSPEQVNSQRYGKKKDIWSIGVLAYQLLLKRSPFIQQLAGYMRGNLITEGLFQVKIPDKCVSEEAKQFLIFVLCQDSQKRPSLEQIISHKFLKL